MATIIVVADIVEYADVRRGGMALFVLQWLAGFERLGHRVVFFNFLDYTGPHQLHDASVLPLFEGMIRRWWRPQDCALIDGPTGASLYGMGPDEMRRAVREAQALVTIGWLDSIGDPTSLVESVRPRVLIDIDPGYTHLWAQSKSTAEIFGVHDVYFTIGANVGTPRCGVPTHGIDWKHAWNPVVLDWWQAGGPVTRDRFTTIASWRDMGYAVYEGNVLGPKAEQFRRFADLPRLAGEAPEIALRIDADDCEIDLLPQHGWILEDPAVVASPHDYREYISGSAAEFTCAKTVYVGTRCGWFSDRSACYLAAGRPVVTQTTGFQDVLPTGAGLFAVSCPEEAAEAIRAVRRDYRLHSAAARRIAEEYFDSDKIAAKVLKEAGI